MTHEVPYKDVDTSAVIWGVGSNSLSLPVPASCPDGIRLLMKLCWLVPPLHCKLYRKLHRVLKKNGITLMVTYFVLFHIVYNHGKLQSTVLVFVCWISATCKGLSEVEGPRPKGRPKRTWREVVKEDSQARKLNTEDAMDRSKWRKLIKDVR